MTFNFDITDLCLVTLLSEADRCEFIDHEWYQQYLKKMIEANAHVKWAKNHYEKPHNSDKAGESMKIVINGNPYDSVIEAIVQKTGSLADTYIVRLKTTVLGEETVLMIPNGAWYDFNTDWYEGGEIELLGFIRLQDVEIPSLT